MCVWEIYTLHSACAWVREIAGDLESEGRDVCMPERQSDRDLCWGPDFTGGWGGIGWVCGGLGESTSSLCVYVGGGGGGVDFR